MDYKKVIKNRKLRLKILRFLSFIPDKPMLIIQYWIKTGRIPDLKNPKRFTEKIQWYKLYYRNPLMVKCVDKYDVREYVKSKGLEEILIPCLGIYESAADIDWEALPNQFVMKNTLGGGGNSVIIVKDKSSLDMEAIKQRVAAWTSGKVYKRVGAREWPYYSGKSRRIIIEEYLDADESEGGLRDYKFTCFDGKPTWLSVITDRVLGKDISVGLFDADFNKQDVVVNGERPLKSEMKKPSTFEEMKRVASILSADFPMARIDLYEHNGKIKFGEITFFEGSGYLSYTPDSFDTVYGKDFKLKRFEEKY